MHLADVAHSPAAKAAVLAVVPALVLMTAWVFCTSGFRELLRPDPSRDAAGLHGRTLVLAGADPLHPGMRTDLADLRGAPVVVCRMDLHTGRWVVGALRRVLAEFKQPITVIAVSTPGDRDPPTWVLSGGVPFRGVLVDGATIAEWGFAEYQPEIRLIDAAGVVASVNLAGEGRDDTITAVTRGLEHLLQ